MLVMCINVALSSPVPWTDVHAWEMHGLVVVAEGWPSRTTHGIKERQAVRLSPDGEFLYLRTQCMSEPLVEY